MTTRDAWIALLYFAVYLASLFGSLESEWVHWLTLVGVPLFLVMRRHGPKSRSLPAILSTFGLRRGNLTRGLVWAVIAGGLITLFQARFGGQAEAIQHIVSTGRAWVLFPLAFLLMTVLAGFTEEFFFRGYLQTRMLVLVHRRWAAVLGSTLLFSMYHLPYAMLNPRWSSHGDWSEAWAAAFGNGLPIGLLLGGRYAASRGNLVACVVLHALINAGPAMTIIARAGP